MEEKENLIELTIIKIESKKKTLLDSIVSYNKKKHNMLLSNRNIGNKQVT